MGSDFIFDFSSLSDFNLDWVDSYLEYPPAFHTTMQEDLATVPDGGIKLEKSDQSPVDLSPSMNPTIGAALPTVKDPLDGTIAYSTPEKLIKTEPIDTLTVDSIDAKGLTATNSADTGQTSVGFASVNQSHKGSDSVPYSTQPTRTSSPYNPRTNTPVNTPTPSQAGPADAKTYRFKLVPPHRASLATGSEPIVSISKPLMRNQVTNQRGTIREGKTPGTQPTRSHLDLPPITTTFPPLIQQSRSLPQKLPPSSNPTIALRPSTPPFSAPHSPVNAKFNPDAGDGMQYQNMVFPPLDVKSNVQRSQGQPSYGWNGPPPFNPAGPSNNAGSSTQLAQSISTGYTPQVNSDLKPPAPVQQYRSAPATPMPPQYNVAAPISSASTPGPRAMPSGIQLVYHNSQPVGMQRAHSNNGPFQQMRQNYTGNAVQQTFNTHAQAGGAPQWPVDGSMRARRGAQVAKTEEDVKPPRPWDNTPQAPAQQGYPQSSNYGVPRLGAGVGYPPQNYRQQLPPGQFYPNIGNPPQFRTVPSNLSSRPIKKEDTSSFFDHVQQHNQNQRARLMGGMPMGVKPELAEGILFPEMSVPMMFQPMERTRFVPNNTAEDFQGGTRPSTTSYRVRDGLKRKREYEDGDGLDLDFPRQKRRKGKAKAKEEILDDESDQEADEETAEGDVYIQCKWPRSDGQVCMKLLWVLGPGTVRKSSSIRRHLQVCKYHDDIQFGMQTITCRYGGDTCKGTTMNLDNIDRHITKTSFHLTGLVPWKHAGFDPQGGRIFRRMTAEECVWWQEAVKKQRIEEEEQREQTKALKDVTKHI